MKYIHIQPQDFSKMKFSVHIKPFGTKVCCCGFIDCKDPECDYSLPKDFSIIKKINNLASN